ncbi:hypothetical protein DFH11DRAFT_1742765 [Phellopilus nigrolimitatus]|nr:hypothetical protein DFH11DRAFT_1742765 [Phellopilus nigrolimitatus]
MDKAGNMLAALSPLYDPDYGSGSGSRSVHRGEWRSAPHAGRCSLVKSLAFPYHDSSTGSRSHTPRRAAARAVRARVPRAARLSAELIPHAAPQLSELVSPGAVMDYFGRPSGGAEFACGVVPGLPTPPPSAIAGGGDEDVAVWGTSVGFGQGEWARFLDVMQLPEVSPLAANPTNSASGPTSAQSLFMQSEHVVNGAAASLGAAVAGNGINDIGVLKHAHISVALFHGLKKIAEHQHLKYIKN